MSKTFEKIAPVLVIVAIGLAFLVGVLWQKVNNLKSGSVSEKGVETPKVSPISVDNLKKIAKNLNLNTEKFNSCLDNSEKTQKITDDINYATTVGVSGTPSFFVNGRFLGGAFPFSVFKEVIDKELSGQGSDDYKKYSESLQKYHDQGLFKSEAKKIDVGNSPVLGDENAKITMVEFTDFECPYCVQFFDQAYVEIKKTYIDTGKIKLVLKHFPLNFHPNAQKAAEAFECAGDQGKYWEMYDKIFSASSSK